MKKAILLLIVALVNTTLLFARGGDTDVINLTDPSGSVSEVLTSTDRGYTWFIQTGINSRIEVTYTVQLSASDEFSIRQNTHSNYIVDVMGASGENNVYSGTIVTDVCDGYVRIELEKYQGLHSTNTIISFSYQVLPSMNNLSVTGKLGVGTMCPNYELDVDGTIRANEVLINIPNGADFVFEDGYELRSLEELSNYVQENKHLPEIAPAAEMETDGVSVNELQIKLLQKIEELTLYVIQQQETIETLKKEINELKNQED